MSTITKLIKAAERVVGELYDADCVYVGPSTGSLEELKKVVSEINNTKEKRLHQALSAISGTDYLVPRVQQGLYKALHLAYKSGKASVGGLRLL